jgi:hypothetical protein
MNPLARLLPFALLILGRCTAPAERQPQCAFYHWRTRLQLGGTEAAYLDSLACKKLYVKVLDIGISPENGQVAPFSRLEAGRPDALAGRQVVPVVFCTNAVFGALSETQSQQLARRVAQNLSGLPAAWGVAEWQLDCDWTGSTQAAFFRFLRQLRPLMPPGLRLSATIRLHQYKFPGQTGVPPVDRGMLMLYNTGDIESEAAHNSIYDPADAAKYLQGAPKRYPLPLDVALPIFSWTLAYREGELWKIMPGIPDDLRDSARFSPNLRVKKGTFVAGHYLRPGDQLRVERMSPALLRQAAQQAAGLALAADPSVAFFHLDSALLAEFPVQLLDSLCQTLRHPPD